MSTGKALIVALLLVLPGVSLRVAPYVERVVAPAASRATPVKAEAASTFDFASTPARLSQRPLVLVAAGFLVEVGIYIVAITILLRSRRFVEWLAAISRRQQAFRAVFFAALIAGFLAGSHETFPFVAWRMYSGMPESPPSAFTVNGVTRSGAAIRLDLATVLPILGRYRAYSLVAERAAAIGDEEASYDSTELTTALSAMARLYNLQNSADPLERLSVSQAFIPLSNREPPWRRDERVVATVEVSR